MKAFRFTFKPVEESQRDLIHGWLAQDYIKEWIHGQGLKNLLANLERFFKGASDSQHWVAYDKETPFAYLLTSRIDLDKEPDFARHSSKEGEAITLDLFICDTRYLGKGLSHIMIREFLLSRFPHVKEVFIDPEATNLRAIRAYEKVGFCKVSEFVAAWHPVPHILMKLSMKEIVS